MHAFVDREDQKRRFRGLLHEEDWRSITGFKVQLVNTEIRLTKQRKEIVLTRDTQVSNSECFNGFIPLDLIPFGDVYRSAVQDGTSFLRDFIGQITIVRELDTMIDPFLPRNMWNMHNKYISKIDFMLLDNNGNGLNFRAKGELADKFKRFWLCYGYTGTNIILLTDWRVVGSDGGINVESVQGISTFDFHPTGHLEVEHFENIFLHPTSDDSDVELMDG
ncbi:unnamed protein product [Microthlaspi erraticum]|uniref:Uncharacterized protein n=1 Tax=Microthlaspi erraticum TaxID=1685480 RepID=A0A6D2HP78_9BRAS|nr:unnamed protein product [Microthlaspi erraticum]